MLNAKCVFCNTEAWLRVGWRFGAGGGVGWGSGLRGGAAALQLQPAPAWFVCLSPSSFPLPPRTSVAACRVDRVPHLWRARPNVRLVSVNAWADWPPVRVRSLAASPVRWGCHFVFRLAAGALGCRCRLADICAIHLRPTLLPCICSGSCWLACWYRLRGGRAQRESHCCPTGTYTPCRLDGKEAALTT